MRARAHRLWRSLCFQGSLFRNRCIDIDHRYVKAETIIFRLDPPHPQVVMTYYYEALIDNFAEVLAGYSAEFIVCVKCVACICQTRTMSAKNHALTRLHIHETYQYRAL